MPTYALDRDELLEAIRHDCEAFLGFYLGEKLELAIPEFHKEIWDEFLELLDQVNAPENLTGVLRKLIAVPREHAKTTLTKLAVILFLRYSRLSFCAYTSNTFGVALNAIRDIKEWFLSDQDTMLYGQTVTKKSSESDGLYILQIPVPGQQKLKTVLLKAYGQGTQLRGTLIDGQRPDFLVFDDIESKETAESPTMQAKLDAWCMGTALKAMARRGVCIFIGNMIADTTLLARLSKAENWNPTVLGSIVKRDDHTVEPLWPERWTLEQLLEDYAEYRRLGQGHTWEAEMMNLTNSEVFGESLENTPRPTQPVPEQIQAGFLCLDPAFGKNAWNDESAITVHARMLNEDGTAGDIPCVIDSRKGRWGTDRVFDEMLELSMYWGIRTWVIEAQAAQRLLIPLFRTYMRERGLDEGAILLLPVYSGNDSKASRILAFRTSCIGGSYGVVDSEQDLIDRLEVYSPMSKEHDDLCDSAAYGTVIWVNYGTIIESHGIAHQPGALFRSHGTSLPVASLAMGIP